jgi:hypothetical protein
MPGRRVMDERLSPDFLRQMTHRYGIATLVQIAAIAVTIAAPRLGTTLALVRRLLPAAATKATL